MRYLYNIPIAIYTGTGASHSWLWFVDIMEKHGFFNLKFLDEKEVKKELYKFEIFILPGGDTFTLAKFLGPKGAEAIKEFVTGGGIYIGSCAGAYLPMRSSKPYLNNFNFVNIKIANLAKHLPPAQKLSHKYYTCYGCAYVFHPFRGEVKLLLKEGSHLVAPVYGGPSMIVKDEPNANVLCWYYSFTPNTVFIAKKDIAEETFLKKAAVVEISFNKGKFYLFGPHFEHPNYPEANKFLLTLLSKSSRLLVSSEKFSVIEGKKFKNFITHLKREVSNMRIVAFSIEHKAIYWKIGEKIYEPQKIIVFLEYMWKRIKILEKINFVINCINETELDRFLNLYNESTKLLRTLKKLIIKKENSLNIAKSLFVNLLFLSKTFFNMYFATLKFNSSIKRIRVTKHNRICSCVI